MSLKIKRGLMLSFILLVAFISISRANVGTDMAVNSIDKFSPNSNPVFTGEENFYNMKTKVYKTQKGEIFHLDAKNNEILYYLNSTAKSSIGNEKVSMETARNKAANFKNQKFFYGQSLNSNTEEFVDHGYSAEYSFTFRNKENGILLPSYITISVNAYTGDITSAHGRNINSTIPAKILSEEEAIKIAKTQFAQQDIKEIKTILDQWTDGQEGIVTRWGVFLTFNKNDPYAPSKGRVVINAENAAIIAIGSN